VNESPFISTLNNFNRRKLEIAKRELAFNKRESYIWEVVKSKFDHWSLRYVLLVAKKTRPLPVVIVACTLRI
jgi:hypothetical protein